MVYPGYLSTTGLITILAVPFLFLPLFPLLTSFQGSISSANPDTCSCHSGSRDFSIQEMNEEPGELSKSRQHSGWERLVEPLTKAALPLSSPFQRALLLIFLESSWLSHVPLAGPNPFQSTKALFYDIFGARQIRLSQVGAQDWLHGLTYFVYRSLP